MNKTLKPALYAVVGIAISFSSSEAALASVIPSSEERECKRFLARGDQLFDSAAYHGALGFYQQAVSACPANWQAHLKYGQSLLRLGSNNDGLRELFQSIILNQTDPEGNIPARAEVASILMKQGDYDEAGGQLKQILDLRPDDVTVRGNYAICLEHLGFVDLAIEQFKIIVKKNSYDTVVLYNLGAAYLRKADFEAAKTYFNRVVSIDPKNVLSYLGLANAWMMQGDNAKALACCKTAIALAPENHYAYLAFGDALEKSGEQGKAIEAYKRAIQINPKDSASRAALLKILESTKQVANKDALKATQ